MMKFDQREVKAVACKMCRHATGDSLSDCGAREQYVWIRVAEWHLRRVAKLKRGE